MPVQIKLDLGKGVQAEIQQLPTKTRFFRQFMIKVRHEDGGMETGELLLRPRAIPDWVHTSVMRDSGSKLQEVADLLNELIFGWWPEYERHLAQGR